MHVLFFGITISGIDYCPKDTLKCLLPSESGHSIQNVPCCNYKYEIVFR